MSRVSWLALFSVLVLALSPFVAQAQSSTPPSTDTAQASSPTTLIDKLVSETWLPLAERALSSSEDSDLSLEYYKQQFEQERTQRQNDNAERTKELINWQTISEGLSSRVTTLQTFSDSLLSHLGSFQGSEAEKQAAALAAVDGIKAGAHALELQVGVLKVGLWISVPAAVITLGYIGGHALGWWR
jgi:hypothetical protein